MKITVIHGDDNTSSYSRIAQILNLAKDKDYQIFEANEKIGLKQLLTTDDLFNKKRIILIRDINKVEKADFVWLKNNYQKLDTSLIIYSHKSVNTSFKNFLPEITKYEKFDYPKTLWLFLESFYPGNSRLCHNLFFKTIKTIPAEVVIVMLVKHLKDVFLSKVEKNVPDIPAWKLNKLKNQATKFKNDQIKIFIYDLADIDFKVKTSDTDLTSALDFLIVSKLA